MLNGNVIGKVNATTTGSGSGVWSLREQFLAGVASIWPLNRITDSLWSKTALLLKTNGVNNATNATFVDSSTNAFTVTRTGTPTQGSLSPYVPTGYWGGYFNGSTDYLQVASNPAFNLPGDFTIEFWICPVGTQTDFGGIIMKRDPAGWTEGAHFGIRTHTAGTKIGFAYIGDGSTYQDMGTYQPGVWSHHAVTRSGSTIRTFKNGDLVATATNSYAFSGDVPIVIGRNYTSGLYYNGHISNARIVKGTAVYTAAFTPPTAPLTAISGTSLLCLQDNRFKDNSTNNFAITKYGDTSVTRFSPFQATYETTYGGSGYFNGSTDYLTIPNNAGFAFGTGDFTVEAWFETSQTTRLEIASRYNGSNDGSWGFAANLSAVRDIGFYIGNTAVVISAGGAWNLGAWNHVAVSRHNGNLRLFCNGTLLGAVANSTNIADNGSVLAISQAPTLTGGFINGRLSNLRVVKGTAIYTAAFTPPTAPVTGVSGTSLLLNFDNAGVYDAARTHLPTLVDNTKASTTVRKYAAASIAFDGTGDYITIPDAPGLQFGTGDFTVECWWYPTNITGYQTLFSKGYISTGHILLQTGSGDGKPLLYLSGSVVLTSSTAVTVNAWNHLAIVRNGTALAMYLNGLSVATATNSYNLNSTQPFKVSQDGSYPIIGYVEDFRITRAARYTANFTPPTAALASVNPA